MKANDAFLVLPVLQHIIDSTEWDVTNTATFYSGRYGETIAVAPPFRTDLASVPRFVWMLIPRDDKNIVEPAVIHDWLYFTLGGASYAPFMLSRRQCDRILSDAMIVAGAQWWKRHLVYWAVRLGGWKPWCSDARRYRGIRGGKA